MSYRELLLGCGFSREKRVIPPYSESGSPDVGKWQNLTTVDNNEKCKPDFNLDLRHKRLLLQTLKANFCDELHAYEVLEHIGMQGDYHTFFEQFGEYWSLLKPDGYLCATVPHWQSLWAWGDPSHTRIINEGTLVFLSKKEYARQLGNTAMSDYRDLMGDMDFDIVRCRKIGQLLEFVLKAVK